MKYILKKTAYDILLMLIISCCILALTCCNDDDGIEYKAPSQSSQETEAPASETTQVFDTQKSQTDREYSKNY